MRSGVKCMSCNERVIYVNSTVPVFVLHSVGLHAHQQVYHSPSQKKMNNKNTVYLFYLYIKASAYLEDKPTCGSEIIKSWAFAAFAALITSSLETSSSGSPYAIFSPTETENRTGSCNTYYLQRNEAIRLISNIRFFLFFLIPYLIYNRYNPSPFTLIKCSDILSCNCYIATCWLQK